MNENNSSIIYEALSEYEDQSKVILFDNKEFSAEQEQFIRGYLCGKNNSEMIDKHSDKLISKQLMSIRSKYSEPIVELLADEGQLYHGDLAERLKISPSSLNVVIKKMQECNPPVIETIQNGKYKIYTVPTSVKKYIINKRKQRNSGFSIITNENSEKMAVNSDDLFLSLQRFVEVAGTIWKERLNILLQNPERESDINVREAFEMLKPAFVKVLRYDGDEYRELKRFINNDVLMFLIERYVEEIGQCEELLEQLTDCENGERLLRHIKID